MSHSPGSANNAQTLEGNRSQNLRDFTVKIRRVADDAMLGTGIAVSTDGQVVTCAHVARAAGVECQEVSQTLVRVIFPRTINGKPQKQLAKVARYLAPEYDDDIVLLELVDGGQLLSADQVAVLGDASRSAWHPFRSYGYRSLEKYQSGWAEGTIRDCVERPEGLRLHMEPIQLKSPEINSGMSGAAVLDTKRNLVVGIISDTWIPDPSMKDRDTGWGINARLLTFKPFNLPLREDDLPLRPSHLTFPSTPADALDIVAPGGTRLFFHEAPTVPAIWVGRQETLMLLTDTWCNDRHRVIGLIGFAGEGKSSIARRWLEDLIVDASVPRPDVVFWWAFSERASVDEFLNEALRCISGGRISPAEYPSSTAKVHLIVAMLHTIRCIVILDGLEIHQSQDRDRFGQINNLDLRELLLYFLVPGHRSLCVVTSRVPLFDVIEYSTYRHCSVNGLPLVEGLELLRSIGASGSDEVLTTAVTALDGHALALTLLANLPVGHVVNVSIPTDGSLAHAPLDKGVFRLLREYEMYLTEADLHFVILISAFRTPLSEAAINGVCRTANGAEALSDKVSDAGTYSLIERLISYQILRPSAEAELYSIHPLAGC